MIKPTYEELEQQNKELRKEIAEHNQDADTLKNSEQTLDLMINTAPDIIYRLDSKGHVVFINKAISSLGYTPEELIGKSILDIVHPDDKEQSTYRINERRCGDRGTKRYELRLLSKERLSIPFEEKSIGIKEPVYLVDAEGYYETVTTGTKSFLGTLGVARDITERVLAREALRKSEERFRNIYNTSPLAFVIWDLDCRVTDWNEHAEKIFGWSKEDIVSQNFFEYIIPNSAELKVKDVVDSLIHGKQTHSVNENLTKSGKTILCEWYNSLLYDSSGDVIGVISLALDVTEVKKAENDLIQSRENLSVTLSSIGDGVIATDVKGCVTFMNPISEALSGWKQEDAKGKKIQKIFNIKNSKTGKKAENPVERVLKEGVIVGLANHTELKSKDGNRYQIADSAAPIMKEDGEVMGCVLVFRDVTEEYKQGEKLIESEKKYRNLFESSNDANFILHPERGYIDCNRAALTMFGAKSKEEFYSMNPIDISPEYQSDGSMSSEKARQMIDTTFEKGSNFFEWTHKRFNGEEFPCTVHATQVKYGDEFIMHGTIRDITVQRKAEKEILESRQILSDVLNTIPVRVFWKDKNNVYLGCNQLFANDAGRTSPEDIIGDDDFNMGWAEQAELYRSDDKQVMTSGQAKINYEEPQTTPDGEQIWLRTSKIPLLDSKDKIYGILGTYEDITERKKSENIKKVLNNILKSSVETDNLNELLKVVHMELSVLMDAKNFFVALYDKDSDYYTYPYHFDETEKWDISKPEKIEGGLTDYVRKNCKALLLNKQKFQEMLDAGNGVLLGTKPESWIGVPLIYKNEPVGAVVIQSYTNANAYNKEDLDILTNISNQLTMAIIRKQAEEELKKSEERWQSLAEASFEGICFHDKGVISDCNLAFAELFGYTREELKSKSILDLTAEESRETVMKNSLSGYEKPYEAFGLRKDGTKITGEIQGRPFIVDGRELRVTAAKDITVRKKAENIQKVLYHIAYATLKTETLGKLLEVIHNEICTLMEANNFYVALYDKETDLYTFPYFADENDKFEVDEQIKLGKGYTEYVRKNNKTYIMDKETIQLQKEEGKIELIGSPSESWMGAPLQKDGVPFGVVAVQSYSNPNAYTEEDLNVLTYVSGQVAMAIDRKNTEYVLKESEEKYRDLAEGMPIGVFETDTKGNSIYANEHCLQLFGYSRSEYEKGINIASIIAPIDRERAMRNLQKRLEGRKSEHNEYVTLKKDGTEFYSMIFSEPMFKDEKTLGLRGFIIDLTIWKESEEENKKLEKQLFQAQKMESVGRLAGGIAHDFNNILAGIMGYSEMLCLQFKDKDTIEGKAANVIFKGTERAANLTKQLLGFARSGKYEQKPININTVIKDTIKVSEKIFEKQILLNCDYCENVKTVNADINQLDQVFTNIFINAKDAMPSGGKIDIKTENAIVTENDLKIRPELASGEYVRITIADNGTGIPKEILNRIFEPFFTTKREGKGTGLGMASVYGIVKNHDGFIYCDSELGEGSTFTIYLPASNESITEEKTEYEVVLGDSTILVVDDEENVLDITSSSLESLGYVVLTAKSGDEAIEIYKREKENIDLIMLDMIMPGKTGKETYNELRKFNPDIRVIIASGYSQNGTASEILNDGALGFIQKPFRMDELSKVIAEALNK